MRALFQIVLIKGISDSIIRVFKFSTTVFTVEPVMANQDLNSSIRGTRNLCDKVSYSIYNVPAVPNVGTTVVSITGESYRLKDAALAKSKPKES